MTNSTTSELMLDGWLRSVNTHMRSAREDRSTEPRPQRNRARERARREAKRLFRDHEMRIALGDLA